MKHFLQTTLQRALVRKVRLSKAFRALVGASQLAAALLISTSALAQNPEYVSGILPSSGSGNTIPFYYTGVGCRGQMLYPVGCFGSVPNGQYISKIYFSSTTSGTQAYNNMEVRIGQPNITSLTTTYVTGLTEALSVTNFTTTRVAYQWYGIELETPVAYNPSLPLVIEIDALPVASGSWSSLVQSPTISGAFRNYAASYQAASASGSGAYSLYFGFDLVDAAVPNNAGIAALPSIANGFCADTLDVTAEIVNYGNNILDSVYVDWTVNGSPQPGQWFVLGLDTAGSADNDTVVSLGSYIFQTGNVYDVVAWTTMPNSQLDTMNLNDTTSVTVGPAMEGTYVIGSSGNADFPTFTAAVTALNLLGVCDHVVFEVESGTYNEQINVGTILGADENRTVTFISQSGDSSDVILTFAGTTTQTSVVRLNGAKWTRWRNMTITNSSTSYDHCIDITGNTEQTEITNCRFIGTYNTTTSTNATLIFSSSGLNHNLLIKGNRLEGGAFAIYNYGASTTSLESGVVVENNLCINQYYMAIRLYYLDAPVCRGNEVYSNAAYTAGYGIYMGYCDNAMEVSNNWVHMDPNSTSNWPTYGMYITLCDGTNLNYTGMVFNNRVVLGQDTNSTSARAMYQTASDLIYFKNNLFSNHSGGYASYIASGVTIESENNNYYSSGTEIYYLGNTTLANYSALTGFELNGHNMHPHWSDIHQGWLCNDHLDGTGVPVYYVTEDYTGFPRNAVTPDPGALEFIGVNNFSLGGDDTVCGTSTTLQVTGATSAITWFVNSSQFTTNSIELTAGGQAPATFNVNVGFTSATGCGSATDNAVITLVPEVSLDSSLHLCADETEVLDVTGGNGATYLWLPGGQMTSSITVSEPATYSVARTELGCTSSASIVVSKSVGVDILDVESCVADGDITLDATILNGVSYLWDGGSSTTSAQNTFSESGIYNVTATDAFGCASSDQFNVLFIDVPGADIDHAKYANHVVFSSASSVNVGSAGTYFWNFGDGGTSTDANPSHTYAWSGSPVQYTVSLTVANDCGSDAVSMSVTIDPVGVDEVEEGAMQVYPNPAKDVINVVTAENSIIEAVRLMDVSGRIIQVDPVLKGNQASMNIGSIAAGNYVLQVTTERGVQTSQIVVE